MQALPTLTDGSGNYSFHTQLDGTTFQFQFYWNDRQGAWFFNLLDAASNPLIMGRKIVLNLGMIGRFQIPGQPLGELIVLNISGINDPPGLTELGGRLQLVYLSVDDLAILSANIHG